MRIVAVMMILLSLIMPNSVVLAQGTGSITVHKFEWEPPDVLPPAHDGSYIEDTSDLGLPLAGIEFEIFQVRQVDAEPSGEEGADWFQDESGNYFVPVDDSWPRADVTNVDGMLKFYDLATPGIYFVRETGSVSPLHNIDFAHAGPFFVKLPMIVGGTQTNDVHIYVKNERIDPGKWVVEELTHGNRITWEIEIGVPTQIDETRDVYVDEDGQMQGGYKVVDTLDYRLRFLPDSIRIGTIGTGLTPTGGTVTTENNNNLVDLFKVSYTEPAAGEAQVVTIQLKNVSEITADDTLQEAWQALQEVARRAPLESVIYIQYDTLVLWGENHLSDTNVLTNEAVFTYEGKRGYTFTYPMQAEKQVYGLQIYKHIADYVEKPLAGATFYLFTEKSDALAALNKEDDWQSGASIVKTMEQGELIPWQEVTETNGNAYFLGLSPGTYYLVESEAPGNYNLLRDIIEITIKPNGTYEVKPSRDEEVVQGVATEGIITIYVANKSDEDAGEGPGTGLGQIGQRLIPDGLRLPQTGDLVTIILVVIGILLLITSVWAFKKWKK